MTLLRPQTPTQNTSDLLPATERQIAIPENAFTAGEFDLKTMRARIYTLAR